MLEVLLPTSASTRVLTLVGKRTSTKSVEQGSSPLTGDSLSEVWRFLHTHYANVTLQGFALGLRRKVQ